MLLSKNTTGVFVRTECGLTLVTLVVLLDWHYDDKEIVKDGARHFYLV
jgi:hypothetical protein